MDTATPSNTTPTSDVAKYRQRVLQAIENLQPFPSVATNLFQLCQKDDQNVAELVEMIECDPVIAMKVLSTANSPLYGYSRQVASIQHAVVILGFRNVSRLAISFATSEVFSGGGKARGRQSLFYHSLGCASVARQLADEGGEIDADLAYLGGVMHDVGKLVLFDVVADEHPDILSEQMDDQRDQWERERFGISHSDIGMKCGERWGLPPEICTAIGFHHNPHQAPQHQPLATLINRANKKTIQWGLGAPDSPAVNTCDSSSPTEDDCDELREAASKEFEILLSVCSAS